MKTLRLIGMTAVAVVVGYAFSACDDDVTDEDPFGIVNTEWRITDCSSDVDSEFGYPTRIVFYDNERGRLYCDNGSDYVEFSYEERDVGMLEIHIDNYDYWEGDWTNKDNGYKATYRFTWGTNDYKSYIDFEFIENI